MKVLFWIFGCFVLIASQIVFADGRIELGGVSRFSSEDVSSFDSGIGLKQKKKMGLTTSLAGAHGMAGINIDINLTGDLGLGIGVGGSRGFRSFNLNVKQTLGGRSVLPYFVGGFSRWYNNANHEIVRSSPGFFARDFLSGGERASGQFAENILYPGLGLQYLNLSGDWQGWGGYFELLYLVDVDDFQGALTAGIGSSFYF